jgi:hypothetical protein
VLEDTGYEPADPGEPPVPAPQGDRIQGFEKGVDFIDFDFDLVTITSSGSNSVITLTETTEILATVINAQITETDFLS